MIYRKSRNAQRKLFHVILSLYKKCVLTLKIHSLLYHGVSCPVSGYFHRLMFNILDVDLIRIIFISSLF